MMCSFDFERKNCWSLQTFWRWCSWCTFFMSREEWTWKSGWN
jgi:hypothetical protein